MPKEVADIRSELCASGGPGCPPFNHMLELRSCCAAARTALDPSHHLKARSDRHWNRCTVAGVDMFDNAARGVAALARDRMPFPGASVICTILKDLEVPTGAETQPDIAMVFTWRLMEATVHSHPYAAYCKLRVSVGGEMLALRVATCALPAVGSFAGRGSLMETLQRACPESKVPLFPVPVVLKEGLCYLPPYREYTLDRLRSRPEELATLAYVMTQAHVVAILHAAAPRWNGTLCVPDSFLPQVWERVVKSGMFRWPWTMWLASGQEPTTRFLDETTDAGASAAQGLQIEPTELFLLSIASRTVPANSIATASQLASLLAAAAAWGDSHCTATEHDDGMAAARFARDLGTGVRTLVDALNSDPRRDEIDTLARSILRRASLWHDKFQRQVHDLVRVCLFDPAETNLDRNYIVFPRTLLCSAALLLYVALGPLVLRALSGFAQTSTDRAKFDHGVWALTRDLGLAEAESTVIISHLVDYSALCPDITDHGTTVASLSTPLRKLMNRAVGMGLKVDPPPKIPEMPFPVDGLGVRLAGCNRSKLYTRGGKIPPKLPAGLTVEREGDEGFMILHLTWTTAAFADIATRSVMSSQQLLETRNSHFLAPLQDAESALFAFDDTYEELAPEDSQRCMASALRVVVPVPMHSILPPGTVGKRKRDTATSSVTSVGGTASFTESPGGSGALSFPTPPNSEGFTTPAPSMDSRAHHGRALLRRTEVNHHTGPHRAAKPRIPASAADRRPHRIPTRLRDARGQNSGARRRWLARARKDTPFMSCTGVREVRPCSTRGTVWGLSHRKWNKLVHALHGNTCPPPARGDDATSDHQDAERSPVRFDPAALDIRACTPETSDIGGDFPRPVRTHPPTLDGDPAVLMSQVHSLEELDDQICMSHRAECSSAESVAHRVISEELYAPSPVVGPGEMTVSILSARHITSAAPISAIIDELTRAHISAVLDILARHNAVGASHELSVISKLIVPTPQYHAPAATDAVNTMFHGDTHTDVREGSVVGVAEADGSSQVGTRGSILAKTLCDPPPGKSDTELVASIVADYEALGHIGTCALGVVSTDFLPAPHSFARTEHRSSPHYMHGALFGDTNQPRAADERIPVFSIDRDFVTQREYNRIHDFLGLCPWGGKLSGILPIERSRWSDVMTIPCPVGSPGALRLKLLLTPRSSFTRPWKPFLVVTDFISRGRKRVNSTRVLRNMATHDMIERNSQDFALANSDSRGRIRETDALAALMRSWRSTGLISGMEVTDAHPVTWPPANCTLFVGCKGMNSVENLRTCSESPPTVWWYFAWRDILPTMTLRCLIIRGCSATALETIQDIIEQAEKVCCWDLHSMRARQPMYYRPLDCASQPVIDLQKLFTHHVLLEPRGCRGGSFVSLIEHFFFRDAFRIHAAAEINPPFHDAFDRPPGSTPSAQAPPFGAASSDSIPEYFTGEIDLVTEGSNIGVVHLLYLAATAIVGILSNEPLALMDMSFRRLRRLLRACPAMAKPKHPSPYQCTRTSAVNTPNENTASFRCLGRSTNPGGWCFACHLGTCRCLACGEHTQDLDDVTWRQITVQVSANSRRRSLLLAWATFASIRVRTARYSGLHSILLRATRHWAAWTFVKKLMATDNPTAAALRRVMRTPPSSAGRGEIEGNTTQITNTIMEGSPRITDARNEFSPTRNTASREPQSLQDLRATTDREIYLGCTSPHWVSTGGAAVTT